VKLRIDTIYKDWYRNMSPGARLAWHYLNLHCRTVGNNGEFPAVSTETLGAIYGIGGWLFDMAIDSAREAGEFVIGDTYRIVNWSSEQADSGAERAANYRERQKEEAQKRFVPPTLDAMTELITEIGGDASDAEQMRDYYESCGWKVGRNPMKDWKAAARNWVKRKTPTKQRGGGNPWEH
jgi:hypothetical protein